MGWCSGTEVFDSFCEGLLDNPNPLDKKRLISNMINTLQNMDWDCERDSAYWDHPLVKEVFHEEYPEWFDEDDL